MFRQTRKIWFGFLYLQLITLALLCWWLVKYQYRNYSDYLESVPRVQTFAKYQPKQGVLVLVGQDNSSIGGTTKYSNGYIDRFGQPAGITHYVSLGWGEELLGLRAEFDWGAGPMNLAERLDSETSKGMLIHLSIDMIGPEGLGDEEIVEGKRDRHIDALASFLNDYSEYPFLLRLGYEFDRLENAYEPETFISAWQRIVDRLREQGVENFATVLSGLDLGTRVEDWQRYYPGEDYVDWLGVSYWGLQKKEESSVKRILMRLRDIIFRGGHFSEPAVFAATSPSFTFARKVNKPMFLAETSPSKYNLDEDSATLVWHEWFKPLFYLIEYNQDIIKAVSYINADWDGQWLWDDNSWIEGSARIESNPELSDLWNSKIKQKPFVHQTNDLYKNIGFEQSHSK